MNFRYSCVPRGRTRAMYSAPRIATANACGLRFKVDTMTSPPGFTRAPSAARAAGGIGHVLEHFHAGHHIERGGRSRAQFLRGDGPILDRDLRLEGVQFGDLEHRPRKVDAQHLRAGAGHRLGQDPAAATDIEDLLARQGKRRARRTSGATD